MKNNIYLKTVTLFFAMFFIAETLFLQSALSAAENSFPLEEITVTARKKTESLQDTPVSITAFTSNALDSRGFTNIGQVGDVTPNMEFDFTAPISGSSNAASIFIRGVGQTDFLLTTDPGVGVYLDGIYIARSTGGVLDLLDASRVEVLRGPQGTVFGKNTIGGAINIITRKPHDKFSGQGDLTLGNDNRKDIRVSINFPIFDNLFARISASSKNRDGYGKRLLTGEELGNENTDAARMALRWVASEELEINISADYTTADEQSPVSSMICFDGDDCGVGAITDLYNGFVAPDNDLSKYGFGTVVAFDKRFLTDDPFTTYGTGPTGSELEIWGVSTTVDWAGNNISVTSNTAYREMNSSFGRDPDHSPIAIVHTSNVMDHKQFSQEFNFKGTLLNDKIDWLVGLYYFDESGSDNITAFATPDLTGLDTAPIPVEIFGPTFPPFGIKGPYFINNASYAAYTQFTYRFNDHLSVTSGIRYTHETKKVDIQQIFNPSPIDILLLAETEGKISFDNLSPRISMEYKANEDVFLYASFSRGFKSGGFTGRYVTPTAIPQSFSPESISAYEIGFKTDLMGNRLRLNGAGFYSDYKDIQVVIFNGIAPESHNVAEGEIKGFEVELTSRPIRELFISAAVGYVDAKYTGIDAVNFASFGIPITLNHMFVNTPEWSLSALMEYTIALETGGEVKFQGDWSYRSKIANDAINTPELIQKGFSLFNARITYAPVSGHWEIAAFGKNLSNETYIISGVADKPSFGLAEATYARPREWGVNVKLSF